VYFEKKPQVAFVLSGGSPLPEGVDDLRRSMSTAISHNIGEGLLRTVPHHDHRFGNQGIFCAEVVDEESGFAANVGGEGAKRKVRDAVVQNVFDGSVEEIKTALGLGSFHVTTVYMKHALQSRQSESEALEGCRGELRNAG